MGGRKKPKLRLEEASRPMVAPYDAPYRGTSRTEMGPPVGSRMGYEMGVACRLVSVVLILLNAK